MQKEQRDQQRDAGDDYPQYFDAVAHPEKERVRRFFTQRHAALNMRQCAWCCDTFSVREKRWIASRHPATLTDRKNYAGVRMSDINFDCPNCGQNLDAPPDLAGLFIECPSCASVIKVPNASGLPAESAESKTLPGKPEFVAPAKSEDKGATMRIDLPDEFRLPPPTQRKFTIKRKER
ncbi:MAG: hypothetical protein M5U15_13505 [Kiritimatiellae bacterium]|nr:hypothetical protein [Kiritimatiellia bacterium]